MPFAYLLRCADGSFYGGAARDLERRLDQHRRGTASRYTRSRLPVMLVWSREVSSWSAALSLERRIKSSSHAEKLHMISGEARHGVRLLLSCEHGGNRVPAPYRQRFTRAGALLRSHRGWDIGALSVARRLSRELTAPLVAATVTRLLVDLNRSPRHPQLFSRLTAELSEEVRADIVKRYYAPHRARIEAAIAGLASAGHRVLHVGVHSFTPTLDGEVRTADIGLLYDPRRPLEREVVGQWQAALRRLDPSLRIRRNYPYRGAADGLTTAMRRLFPAESYLGVELEMNQALLQDRQRARELAEVVSRSLRETLERASLQGTQRSSR